MNKANLVYKALDEIKYESSMTLLKIKTVIEKNIEFSSKTLKNLNDVNLELLLKGKSKNSIDIIKENLKQLDEFIGKVSLESVQVRQLLGVSISSRIINGNVCIPNNILMLAELDELIKENFKKGCKDQIGLYKYLNEIKFTVSKNSEMSLILLNQLEKLLVETLKIKHVYEENLRK